MLREFRCALATISPVSAIDGPYAKALAECADDFNFGIGIGRIAVDSDRDRHAEFREIAHVPFEVLAAVLESRDVLFTKLRPGNTTLHFECFDRCDQHHRIGRQTRFTALDIQELLGTEIRTEPGLGDDVIGKLQTGLGRHDRITAMRDIGERATMHERWIVFHCLHEIGLQRITQQRSHRTLCVKLAHGDGFVLTRVPQHNVTEALLEILEICRQAEDRHDLGRNRDIKAGFAHHTVMEAAETRCDATQCTIVHINDPTPGNAARIDVQFVIPVHVIVDQRREQVVRRANGMEVTREMEVDIGHRDDLCVATACSTALHTETRAEARFAQAHNRFLANKVHGIAETHRRRGLALTGWRWRDRRYEDQLAVFLLVDFLKEPGTDLGLVMAIGN